MSKNNWRSEDYKIYVFVCGNPVKSHLITTVQIDNGIVPKEMPCFGKGCKHVSKMSLPKDRPVPPMIPYPSIEWRKDENNKTLLPWPLSTPENQWKRFK
jgi:hypothetical protein